MLLRNIDAFRGHVNGARYIVKAIHTSLLMLKSWTGDDASNILDLLNIPRGAGDSNFAIQEITRTQFPMKICFAMTIKKAQMQFSRVRRVRSE